MEVEENKQCVEYNFLGPNAGVKVSNICIGTMTFGTPSQNFSFPGCTDEADSHKILDRFYELGGNFIDTANMYMSGQSEQIIGSWMKKLDRSEIVLATKVRFNPHSNSKPINEAGLSRQCIFNHVDKSLKRLGTDYIDLYYSHCWDSGTKLEETLRAFNDIVRSGKVRYVGVSNVTGAQLQKIVDYNKFMGFNQIVALQAEYSLCERCTELELVNVCREEGLSMIPYTPLKGGLLTGKFKREDPDPATSLSGTRLGWTAEKADQRTFGIAPHVEAYRNNEAYWKLIELMQSTAESHGKSVAQVALRWLLQKEAVPSVIIGAKTVQQLEDNMAASAGWKLSDAEMARLDAASDFSAPPTIYPYSIIANYNYDRLRRLPV